ncbi:hybrid sensor histidine kinase/response regulator [Marinomonas mediterranea]|uniref:hybrid sensor histidine kinase/response regulator n=1 Tax=Marinomonas mediterranea TaxID=119864 RepID=UPI00234A109B|nr:ATP-binding protein [Marinomonas mediterranea]WCN09136.1 response regulator [Marinomonas mediterranea]
MNNVAIKARFTLGFLAFIASLFLAASVYFYFEIHQRAESIANQSDEDTLWAMYQLDHESHLFANQSMLLLNDFKKSGVVSDKRLSNTRLRFDILYSRVNILLAGKLNRFSKRTANFDQNIELIKTSFDHIDLLLYKDDMTIDEVSIIQRESVIIKKYAKLISVGGLQLKSDDRVNARAIELRLYNQLGVLVMLLTVTMSIIIALLMYLIRESLRDNKRMARLANDLEETAVAAKVAAQAKSDFLATMSHEIRTPMNAIIGLTHLVLDTELQERQRRYINRIDESSNNLLQLINDILDFSKVESGKLDLVERSYLLDDVLEYIHHISLPTARSKKLLLLVQRDFNLDDAFIGDVTRIKQVLVNVVGNAIKFTDKGYVCVTVKRRQEGGLLFCVEDSGIGIDSTLDVFDGFTQADASTTRKYGGTGLGLSISKRLLELMGGHISFKSQVGRGTTFFIELPYQIDKASSQFTYASKSKLILIPDDRHAAQFIGNSKYLPSFQVVSNELVNERRDDVLFISASKFKTVNSEGVAFKDVCPIESMSKPCVVFCDEAYAKTSLGEVLIDISGVETLVTPKAVFSSLSNPDSLKQSHLEIDAEIDAFNRAKAYVGRRVLVVEDNPVNAEIVRALLDKLGVVSVLAEHGQKALEIIKVQTFDLVLMDIQMPVLDGVSAAREMRLQGQNVPIIALTADVMGTEKKVVFDAGMQGILSKPFKPTELLDVLRKWMPSTETVSDRALLLQRAEAADSLNNNEKMAVGERKAPKSDFQKSDTSKGGLKAFNPEQGLSVMLSDHRLYMSVLTRAKDQLIKLPATLKQHSHEAVGVTEASNQALTIILHNTFSMARNIGAERLAHLIKQLENQGDLRTEDQTGRREQTTNDVASDAIVEVVNEVSTVIAAIDRYLDRHSQDDVDGVTQGVIESQGGSNKSDRELVVLLRHLRTLLVEGNPDAEVYILDFARFKTLPFHKELEEARGHIQHYDYKYALDIVERILRGVDQVDGRNE